MRPDKLSLKIYIILIFSTFLLFQCETMKQNQRVEDLIKSHIFNIPVEKAWPYILNVLFKMDFPIQEKQLILLGHDNSNNQPSSLYIQTHRTSQQYLYTGERITEDFSNEKIYLYCVPTSPKSFKLIVSYKLIYNSSGTYLSGAHSDLFLEIVKELDRNNYTLLKETLDDIKSIKNR